MMKPARQLGKRDVAILLAATGLLLCNVAAVGTGGRGRAKEAVCLTNLRLMAQAWLLYTADNEDKIVNGEADYGTAGTCTTPTAGRHAEEKWWVGTDCHPRYLTNQNYPPDVQVAAIRAGALFPYVGDERRYHCPDGLPGAVRTYSIPDSMNGLHRSGTYTTTPAGDVGETVLWVKKMTEIVAPGPAERLALVDEGRHSPDSYAVHYTNGRWWDPPGACHNGGMNVSCADGHGEHWMWEAAETVATGTAEFPLQQFLPRTPEGLRDLQKMQTGVYGRIGY